MKKFYIVGVSRRENGICAIISSIINHCIYAQQEGYIPIVDMKHYANQYFKDNREFKDNSWEYFFEQPMGYSLDDIKEEDEIIFSRNIFIAKKTPFLRINSIMPIENDKNISPEIIKEKEEYAKLLKFNKTTFDFINTEFNKYIENSKNTLGILCRGTDYTNSKPYKEHIQPQTTTVIKKAKEVLKTYPNINKIFLATEDQKIYDLFKKEFGDMLIDTNFYKYSNFNYDNKFLSEIKAERKNHKYNLVLEYLSSIYILSKCSYFIGGRTTGTKWVWTLADKFDYFYCWELGQYGRGLKQKIYSRFTQKEDGKLSKKMWLLGCRFNLKD